MKTLIKNGRVVTAVDDYKADIFIDGKTEGKIQYPPVKCDIVSQN